MGNSYVVTGGGRGVGRAIAGRLAADGGRAGEAGGRVGHALLDLVA